MLMSCWLLQNIAEWEMTDDEIEVAIKLADESGDGQIDYDEFIAFVFGEAESVQRLQPTGAQPAPQQAHAGPIMAAAAQTPASQQPTAEEALQMPTQELQAQSDAPDLAEGNWQEARQAPSDQLADPQDAMQQPSMTDAWVASQSEGMLSDPDQQQAAPPQSQQGTVYDNALYQAEDLHTHVAQHSWQRSDQQDTADTGQPGDDVRLRIYSDDAEPGQALHSSRTSHEPQRNEHEAHQQHQQQQPWQDSDGLQDADSMQQGALQEQQGSQNQSLGEELPDMETLGISRTSQQHQARRQPAPWDAPEVLLAVPPDVAPDLQQPVAAPQADKATVLGQVLATSKGKPAKPILKTSSRPRHLPPLSYDQLSQGINRSRVGHN